MAACRELKANFPFCTQLNLLIFICRRKRNKSSRNEIQVGKKDGEAEDDCSSLGKLIGSKDGGLGDKVREGSKHNFLSQLLFVSSWPTFINSCGKPLHYQYLFFKAFKLPAS